MNSNLALSMGYQSAMRVLTLAIVAAIICFGASLMTSCQSLSSGTSVLPFDIGIRYQLEPDLYLTASPKSGGGFDVKIEGEGQLSKHVVKDGDAYVITSPNTGIIYRVTPQANGRPLIEIVGGGNGRLQLVPTTPPKSDPVLTQPTA